MILLLGDFPSWLPIFTLVGGVTTALIIGGIAAGAAATAGATAYGVKSAVEGNWPWEDPEAWMTGFLKANTSGLGQVISSAQGEPTIVEQLKGESGGTSRGGGTAGVLQGATGQGIGRAITRSVDAGPSQQSGLRAWGRSRSPTMGGQAMVVGAGRYDAIDAEDGATSPTAARSSGKPGGRGIGAGTTVASLTVPYIGSYSVHGRACG